MRKMHMKKVNVLLSVYNPNRRYLEEQLRSLDNQTYDNMDIIIFDDCVKNRCDQKIFEDCLKKKQYHVLPYKEKNLGYLKAFEYLVKESEGEYIALCDQDDIWTSDKIEKCVDCLEHDDTLLVVTDRKLIDGEGKVLCDSVRHTSKQPHEIWNTGDDIGVRNFFTACAPGMCMVVVGDFARSTLPFSEYTGHDKWLIVCACACGRVSFLDEPLSYYRRYGQNVTGVLAGIKSKKDYDEQRIMPHFELIKEFDKRYPGYEGISRALEFANARLSHNPIALLKNYSIAPNLVKFEVVMAVLPEYIVKILIRFLQKQK